MKPASIRALNTVSAPDSHKGECGASRLAANFREIVTLEGQTDPAISAQIYYPRIKRLANGKYILFHQDYRLGVNIYYSLSDDCRRFSPRQKLFAARPVVRDDGEEDKLMYATADAAVLPNGEILAVCSYRYSAGYKLDAKYGGLVMKRSTNNGATFSEERQIYLGRNWEPSVLVLQSGEVQVYFSHTAPKFYLDKTVRTDSPIKTSSGTAIIRSYDGGETWSPKSDEPPYAAHRVTQSYICTMENGTKCFTNQMATAVELGDGTIAVATESDMSNYTFKLTMSYSHDNWARSLDIDEDGPADKITGFDDGAGPYLAHFESGETILSYNLNGAQHIRTGDEQGRNFDAAHEIIAFGGRFGYWGSITVDNPHCLISAYPNIGEDRSTGTLLIDNDLMIGKFYLNHRIDCKPLTQIWAGNTDALFFGSRSQAQCTIRTAYDSEHVYVRADRLDRYLCEADSAEVQIRTGEDIYTMGANVQGRAWYKKNGTPCDWGAEFKNLVYGELDKWSGDENGIVTIFSLPISVLGGADRFEITASLKNFDGGDMIFDSLGGWFPVRVLKS